jgi:NADH-quinone oxidoreductase subunit J
LILADSIPLSPMLLLILCALAGVGTVFLLPSRREAPLSKIGGVIVLSAGLIFAAILIRWSAGSGEGGMGAYFWIFSAIAIVGAMRVISHPKPVYSALYFVLTVFASAGLFLLLWAEFMAAALVLIYAGAILVTYVFVIMLAAEAAPAGASRRGLTDHDTVSREPVIAAAVGFALMGVQLFVIFDKANHQSEFPVAPDQSSIVSGATHQLGEFLF